MIRFKCHIGTQTLSDLLRDSALSELDLASRCSKEHSWQAAPACRKHLLAANRSFRSYALRHKPEDLVSRFGKLLIPKTLTELDFD
eukprot:4145988-Amphidinium_carterae.1